MLSERGECHQAHDGAGTRGKRKDTVVPAPTVLHSRSEPPCCSMMALLPASPIPVPGIPVAVDARKKRVQVWDSSSGGMNSGSVGLPYDGDWRASYLLLEDGVPSIRRVAYDLERAVDDLRATGYPLATWQAEVQRQGRFTRPS
jgi:hypothetical protein